MVNKYYGGFKDLILCKDAKELMILTYKLTNSFPKNVNYDLTI